MLVTFLDPPGHAHEQGAVTQMLHGRFHSVEQAEIGVHRYVQALSSNLGPVSWVILDRDGGEVETPDDIA